MSIMCSSERLAGLCHINAYRQLCCKTCQKYSTTVQSQSAAAVLSTHMKQVTKQPDSDNYITTEEKVPTANAQEIQTKDPSVTNTHEMHTTNAQKTQTTHSQQRQSRTTPHNLRRQGAINKYHTHKKLEIQRGSRTLQGHTTTQALQNRNSPQSKNTALNAQKKHLAQRGITVHVPHTHSHGHGLQK